MTDEADGDHKTEGLSRSISLPMLTLYGLGTVLGAGIYVVVGDVIGRAGALAPLSFLAAAVAAGLTAFSYAGLSTRVPLSGGSEAYAAAAFGRRWLTLAVGWGIIATGLVSAATIVTGLVGYLGVFVDSSRWLVVPVAVGTLTAVAAVGIKQSTWFMCITTAAGLAGLLLVLFTAGGNLASYPDALAQGFASNGAATGLMLGAFLAFYAFIGFEDLVTLAEEAKEPRKSLPIAIFIVLGVALLLYVLIAATAVSTLDASQLAESEAPLVAVAQAEGGSGTILAALSIAIIVNSALAQMVMAARVVHDLGVRRRGAPRFLARINPKTHTPLIATILAGAVVSTLALFFPTERLASWTSYIILSVFSLVNASLIKLKLTKEEPEQDIRTFPMAVPIAGLAVSLLLIAGETMLGN